MRVCIEIKKGQKQFVYPPAMVELMCDSRDCGLEWSTIHSQLKRLYNYVPAVSALRKKYSRLQDKSDPVPTMFLCKFTKTFHYLGVYDKQRWGALLPKAERKSNIMNCTIKCRQTFWIAHVFFKAFFLAFIGPTTTKKNTTTMCTTLAILTLQTYERHGYS